HAGPRSMGSERPGVRMIVAGRRSRPARSTRRRTLKLTRRTRRFKSNGGAGPPPPSLPQLGLQTPELFRPRGVVAAPGLALAHRMQDGGVIAPPEAPPDLGQ